MCMERHMANAENETRELCPGCRRMNSLVIWVSSEGEK